MVDVRGYRKYIHINMTELLITYPQFILREIRKTDFI